MSTTAEKDLETMLGDPKKALLAMSIPLAVSYAVVQINSFADASWCSGLGVEASSAVATICPVYWILNGIGAGIGIGASAVISSRLGRGLKDRAEKAAWSAVAMTLAISLACIPITYMLIGPCISWLGADDIAEQCWDYIAPIVLLCPFNILSGTLAGTMRGEGAARKTMAMTSAAAVSNMAMDPLLIYVLDMGLYGAGLATALSSALSCAICLCWYLRGSLCLRLKTDGSDSGEAYAVLRAGAPRSAEYFLVYFMSMVQRAVIISSVDTVSVALYSMTWMFVSVACVASMAVGAALVPICSSALAARDTKKAETAFRYSCKACLAVMTVAAALLFVFADQAVAVFSYTGSMEELRDEFAFVLRVYCVFIPVVGLIDVGSSMLQAMGKAKVSLASSFLRNIVIIALLAEFSPISSDAVFYSLAAAELIGVVLMMAPAMLYFSEYKRAGRLRSRARFISATHPDRPTAPLQKTWLLQTRKYALNGFHERLNAISAYDDACRCLP